MTASQLKNAILQYAIQGKLVPQNPDDEPASVLMEKIRKERKSLVKVGKIKKDKPVKPITSEEIPFEIPESWEWVRLGEIFLFENGDRSDAYPIESDYVKDGIPFWGAKDMVDNKLVFSETLRFITKNKFNSLRSGKLADKDFVCLLRGGVGKWAQFYANDKYKTGFINAQMVIIRAVNADFNHFFSMYLNSSLYINSITDKTTGTAVSQMSALDLMHLLIPLPPLAEQNRIVKRINELLSLVNEYDNAEQELTVLDNEFPEKLKKSILQTAVQGKLLPQNLNDEPASVLVERIRVEREKLIRNGKIKRNKNESFIFKRDNSYYEKRGGTETCIDNELPFEIPENWAWVRLGSLSSIVSKGTTPRGGNIAYKDHGIGFLRVENIGKNGELLLDSIKYIEERTHKGILKRSILQEEDILISIAGALGRVAIVSKEALPLNTNQAVAFVRWINKSFLNIRLIEIFLNSPDIQKQLLTQTKITAIPNLTLEIISSCIIPLPPLAEQHTIVVQIDNLLPKLR